jgi:serine/threonine protein kinase
MEKKKDYELMHKLGEGSYGSVYRAKWVKNDRIVAIKRTKTTH